MASAANSSHYDRVMERCRDDVLCVLSGGEAAAAGKETDLRRVGLMRRALAFTFSLIYEVGELSL